MTAKPRMRRTKAMQLDAVERPHLSMLPLPRFSQIMRLGSGAVLTVGHLLAKYLWAIVSYFD